MTNKLKKGVKLQDLHTKRTTRKLVVEKISSDACTVKNVKTGRVTTISKERVSNPSRFKLVS